MLQVISRMLVAPLIALALICSGLAMTSLAPEQAFATTTDQLTASASVSSIGAQALKASKAKKAKKAFAGKYVLVKMKQDGEVTGKKDLDTLHALGLDVTLNLKKNGKAVLNLFGEKMKGTWKATTTKRGKIKLGGGSVVMKRNGKKVTLVENGASLTFKKK